jgi:hypothetical protein
MQSDEHDEDATPKPHFTPRTSSLFDDPLETSKIKACERALRDVCAQLSTLEGRLKAADSGIRESLVRTGTPVVVDIVDQLCLRDCARELESRAAAAASLARALSFAVPRHAEDRLNVAEPMGVLSPSRGDEGILPGLPRIQNTDDHDSLPTMPPDAPQHELPTRGSHSAASLPSANSGICYETDSPSPSPTKPRRFNSPRIP